VFKTIRSLVLATLAPFCLNAATLTYGDIDLLGFGYPGGSTPTAGATLEGLAPNAVTLATNPFGHTYPFSPGVSEFPGTDQIYVGTTQTDSHDGYSNSSPRLNGPQIFTLDYSALISAGSTLFTLTLGIAADDFQFPALGQPFTASVNGSVNTALTNQLNAFDQGGPVTQFFTIGLDPSIDTPNHILTLSINVGGDGGDGWAVDYLTVGITTSELAVPEPVSAALSIVGLLLIGVVPLGRRLRI
jgi:hypothetical protein